MTILTGNMACVWHSTTFSCTCPLIILFCTIELFVHNFSFETASIPFKFKPWSHVRVASPWLDYENSICWYSIFIPSNGNETKTKQFNANSAFAFFSFSDIVKFLPSILCHSQCSSSSCFSSLSCCEMFTRKTTVRTILCPNQCNNTKWNCQSEKKFASNHFWLTSVTTKCDKKCAVYICRPQMMHMPQHLILAAACVWIINNNHTFIGFY